MRLLDKIRDRVKELTEETASKAAAKETPAPEHGFLDAVKEEIGASKSSPEVTVEEVYRDLQQRKQDGEMPRIPKEALMDVLGKPPASKVYASGAVFELSHRYRDHFLKALRAEDTGKLSELFRATYALFMDQPETVGLSAAMFNRKSEDTDPKKWEVSCASLPDGSRIALCRMPVRDAQLTARLAGIVFSDAGDRYYSCMLNRDRNKPSEVVRNMGKIPHEKAGVIRGNETEPLKAFLECIREDRA